MIANATTLILGAGASKPLGYPTGNELRQIIVGGPSTRLSIKVSERFRTRFKLSQVSSIDAFLAEPANQEFAEEGTAAIAAALLPCEFPERDADWYGDLFNAIRFPSDSARQKKLKVVTFNYDLSLEFFLFRAFKNTYHLVTEDARAMLDANVEFIHVYGTLGQLCELHDTQTSHNYGDQVTRESISVAAGGIHIMGRHEQRREIFQQARLVIQEAEFIGVLGYGFDPINNENLGLSEALRDKYPFITGYGMGCGSRARFAGWGFGNRDLGVLMGGKSEGVRDFLAETDFLRWINEPSASAHHASQLITTVFRDSILPYAR